MKTATYEHIWSKICGKSVPKSKKNRPRSYFVVLIHTETLRVIEEIHEALISCFTSDPTLNKLWCSKDNFLIFLSTALLPNSLSIPHNL